MTETPIELEFRVNRHVERMRRYIPLDAGADQLIQEQVDVQDAVHIDTKAQKALLNAVRSPGLRLVLLTGDAGHGKTWLCFSLLQGLGWGAAQAAAAITDLADGDHDLEGLQDGRRLRIVKDLSDFDPLTGAEIVRAALEDEQRVTVVCANEGRLRDVVSRDPRCLGRLLRRLQDGLRGDAAVEDAILIINLNFQSVAADQDPLIGELLRRWVADGRNWVTCASCRARPLCPIFENRRLLVEAEAADLRKDRWAQLLRAAERTGVVVTIRELLITVAYAITGGLGCEKVHELVERQPVDRSWQWKHIFFQMLFDGMAALRRASPGLRIPSAMERLDPGRFADRRIDESLGIGPAEVGFRPYDPTGDSLGADWRSKSAEEARAEQLLLTRFLRRQAFFEDASRGAAQRVGFRFAEEFEQVVLGDDAPALKAVRDRVVRGLAAAQGLTSQGEKLTALPIVEPALAGKATGVAILDRDVRLASVELMSLSSAWERSLHRSPEITDQVDWLERFVAVNIEKDNVIALDLRTFELVCAAGEGMDLVTVDPGVARRLLLELAVLAGSADGTDRITIVEPGQRWHIDLDIGDQLIGGKA